MANVAHYGFWPLRESVARVRKYEVVSSNTNAIFIGDLVSFVTTGTVQQSAAGDTNIVGVVKAIQYSQNGRMIDAAYLPATTTYSPTARGSATATRVWVFTDPTAEFVGSVASHADTDTAAEVYAALHDNMDISTATAGNTVYGWSGMQLDGNVVNAAANLRLLEIYKSPDNDLASVNWKAVFKINEHIETGTAGTGA